MGLSFTPAKKRRLGEILMDAGLVNEQQLRVALTEQRRWGGRLGHTLVQLGFVDEQAMVSALSRQLNLPVVDLDSTDLGTPQAGYLRYEIAERYGVCPLQADTRKRVIQVATSDPTNADIVQALTFQTGMKVDQVVATAGSIERAIRRIYGRERRASAPPAPSPGALAEKMDVLANRVAELETQLKEQQKLVRGLVAQLEEHATPAVRVHAETESTSSSPENPA